MKKAKSFGVRGMSAEERAAVNPYLGYRVASGGVTAASVHDVDQGLRSFMMQVYLYMGAALVVTATAAMFTFMASTTTELAHAARDPFGAGVEFRPGLYLTPFGWDINSYPISYFIGFGPLLMLMVCAPVFRGLNSILAGLVFLLVATLIGVSFSTIAMNYGATSITRVFFTTAAAFGGLSLVGYCTTKDLSGWGSFLWMGVIGIIVAAVVNLFMDSDALQFAICSIGVLVFSGFTAYDTQSIKEGYSGRLSSEEADALAINGALDLYLDFVNLFYFLIRLTGDDE